MDISTQLDAHDFRQIPVFKNSAKRIENTYILGLFSTFARSAVNFRTFWRRWNSLAIIPAETPCFKAYFWPPLENAMKMRAPGGGRMSALSPAPLA